MLNSDLLPITALRHETEPSRTGFQIRAARKDERPKLLPLLRAWASTGLHVFRPEQHPEVFAPDGDAELVCAFAGPRALAHVATRRVTLVTPDGPLAGMFIGGLITTPELRWRGLGTALLNGCVEAALRDGCDAVYVWADCASIASRLGFIAAGAHQRLVLRPYPGVLAAGLRPAQARDVLGMLDLHREKPLRVERSLHDMALLLSKPDLTTLVLERAGRVAAYACCSSLLGLPRAWHEFGGSDADVATLLLGAIDVLGQDRVLALVPPYRGGFAERLRTAVVERRDANLVWRRALTPRGAAPWFADGLDRL